jgi:hypothetical protein
VWNNNTRLALFRSAFFIFQLQKNGAPMSLIKNFKKFIIDKKDDLVDLTGLEVRAESIPSPCDENETILDIAGYKQNKSYSCGFVAGLMVLHTFYPRKSINSFYYRINPDPVYGTQTNCLISALRKSGISVSVVKGNVFNFNKVARWIEEGKPIITTVDGDSHWVVIFGVGYKPNRIFIAGYGLFQKQEFTWSEFRHKIRGGLGDSLICSGK